MVYHVSPWLEMVRAFNQLILGACLVIDIASVSLAQEYLVRGAGVKMSSSYPPFGLLHGRGSSDNLSSPTKGKEYVTNHWNVCIGGYPSFSLAEYSTRQCVVDYSLMENVGSYR